MRGLTLSVIWEYPCGDKVVPNWHCTNQYNNEETNTLRMIQRVNCPICHKKFDKRLVEFEYERSQVENLIHQYYGGRVDMKYLQDGKYSILYCTKDDFYWKEYILGDGGMKKLYEKWVPDAHYGTRPLTQYNDRNPEQKLERISRVKNYFNKPVTEISVLDFGAGWSHFAQASEYFGFDTFAYELSSKKITLANDIGIDVISSIDELSSMNFDYIHMREVLEHVPDPNETVDLISNILSEGGLCYVTVPDASHSGPFTEQIITENPFHPLEHINGFTGTSLRALLNVYNLKPTDPPNPTIYYSHIERIIKNAIQREPFKYRLYNILNDFGVINAARSIHKTIFDVHDRYENIETNKEKESDELDEFGNWDFDSTSNSKYTLANELMSIIKFMVNSELVTNCYFIKR